MLASILCLVPGIFIAILLYFVILNSFSELEMSKVFWIYSLSLLAGGFLGAGTQDIVARITKILKKAPR